LETIKVYENKPADIIQGQMDTDYLSRVLFFGSHWFRINLFFYINLLKFEISRVHLFSLAL